MAKFFNLNSQRTSHEQVEGLPTRRFTDTHLKTGQSRAVETIYRLQKNAYFQGLMNKDVVTPQHPSEEKSGNGTKSATRPLDMLVFTRKNAIVLEANPRPPMSPKQNSTSKMVENSPTFMRPSHRKVSLASSKGDSKAKDNLKQKVMELEKKLKNFEKVSKTMREDNSGDKLEKKRSIKKVPLQMTSSPNTQTLRSKLERSSPKEEPDSSHRESPSRLGNPQTFTSLSRAEGIVTPKQYAKQAKPGTIEYELAKLKDRLTKAIDRDLTLIKVFNRSNF
jgi:hypothetical protein